MVTEQTALAVAYPTHVSQLFEEIQLDTFATLVLEHDAQAKRMDWMADMAATESDSAGCDVLRYFALGNNLDGAEAIARTLFDRPKAMKALAADYWGKAMRLTDCYEEMIAADKRKWEEMLKRFADTVNRKGVVTEPAVPDFTPEAIQATFASLIAARADSFAKRVDGVWRALSPNHVTNRPHGFKSKLILANLLDSGRYSCGRWSSFEYLRDLRRVIGTFMGRGRYNDTKSDLHQICKDARDYHWGQYVWVDGGSWALKAYQNGNVHVKLHPEMVYRLNNVLASIYPNALADDAVRKPQRKKSSKHVPLEADVLSFATVAFIRDRVNVSATKRGTWRTEAPRWHYELDQAHRKDYERVMTHLGGVESRGGWEFDYCPEAEMRVVARSGVVPNRRGHQFYPTPPSVSELVVEAAELYAGCSVLEPSAGTGNLIAQAKQTVKGCTFVAVEAAALHAKVLEGRFRGPDRGGTTDIWHEDFMALKADDIGGEFDRVIMNPPFADGRAREHVTHAAGMLRVGGKLAAVLPLGCRDLELEGCVVRVLHEVDNAFEGTSVSVLVVTVERTA